MGRDFWIPKYKWEVQRWLMQRYPKRNWKKYTKKKLLQMYVAIRHRIA